VLHQLATLRRRNVLSSLGVCLPLRVFKAAVLPRPLGLRGPSMSLSTPSNPKDPWRRFDSEVFTPPPIRPPVLVSNILSQALAPLQSFTSTSPQNPLLRDSRRPLPLPRFLPLQRFPSHKEPHSPNGSQPAGYVAPSGFLTLSTLCSPHGLPSLFHPGPAHGVNPSRSFSSRGAVRPSGRRIPRGFAFSQLSQRYPSGIPTPPEAQHQAWRLTK
jgi:hypothetical protein